MEEERMGRKADSSEGSFFKLQVGADRQEKA